MRVTLWSVTSILLLMGGCSSTQEAVIPKKEHVDTTSHMDYACEEGSGLVVPSYLESNMIDKDHDGIADGKDRCLDTPIGVEVDVEGCAFDRDQDGVKDYEDKCPNSMTHARVKADGCADFVSFDLYYAPRVDEITPKSMLVLEKAVGFLQEHPEYKVRIIGHTDNVGDAAYNMKLSQDRAAAVLKIFNRKGINVKRLSATGKGESMPVESNDTDEGRALNRRIEVELYL